MDDGSGFDDHSTNIHMLDPDSFHLDFSFDKTQPSSSGTVVDPGLATSLSPFAAHAAGASHFLTPPTTAPSPRGSGDYFDASFSANSAILNAVDLEQPSGFLWLDRPVPTPLSPSSARRRARPPGPSSPMLTDAELSLATSSRTRRRNTIPEPSPRSASSKRKSRAAAKKSDLQRSKNLERNRIAASKCRQKKKEWVQDLEGTKVESEKKWQALREEQTGLQNQISELKNRLMMHAHCNDPNIKIWIQREAHTFVAKVSAPSRQRKPPLPAASGSGSSSGSGSGSASASASALAAAPGPGLGSSSQSGSGSLSVSGIGVGAGLGPGAGLGSVAGLGSLAGLGAGAGLGLVPGIGSGAMPSPVSGFSSGSGFDPGSAFGSASTSGPGSGALPSPTGSPTTHEHAPDFGSMPINLDYMPEELLSGDLTQT